jgi:hypothetical protein
MYFRSLLLMAALCAVGPALAETPEDAGVTVLRGTSAPPPPPAESEQPTVVYREIVQVPYVDQSYPIYTAPAFIVPGRRKAFRSTPAPTTLPPGWPLLGTLAPQRR